MKIYVVDLDGTLCTQEKDYNEAKPFNDRIEKINKLYDEGNRIIIDTARGYVTKKKWRTITKKQLKEWGVKYHELYVGTKRFGTFYIDDKSINARDFFR